MIDWSLIYIAVSASIGALISGLLGWWDNHEPFDKQKFMSNVFRAAFAGMTFALTYVLQPNIIRNIFLAILGGAGIDVLGNRIKGGTTPRNTVQEIEKVSAKLQQLTNDRTKSQAVSDGNKPDG